MTSRKDHLDWCKQRAIEYLDRGDIAKAYASMISDIGKWEGGDLYDALTLAYISMDAMLFRTTAADMRNWIDGFN
jgi:hypothetical protein